MLVIHGNLFCATDKDEDAPQHEGNGLSAARDNDIIGDEQDTASAKVEDDEDSYGRHGKDTPEEIGGWILPKEGEDIAGGRK